LSERETTNEEFGKLAGKVIGVGRRGRFCGKRDGGRRESNARRAAFLRGILEKGTHVIAGQDGRNVLCRMNASIAHDKDNHHDAKSEENNAEKNFAFPRGKQHMNSHIIPHTTKKRVGAVVKILFLCGTLAITASVTAFPAASEDVLGILKVTRALLWLGVVPLVVIHFAFKERASAYGLRPPDLSSKRAFLWTGVVLLLLLATAGIMSTPPSFRTYYAFENPTIFRFVFLAALPLLIYYAAEEFFMRGFLLFRLHKYVGAHAVWISSALFMLLHVTKPSLELPISFFAGMLLAVLALKTKSFVLPAILHFLMGLVLNILVIL